MHRHLNLILQNVQDYLRVGIVKHQLFSEQRHWVVHARVEFHKRLFHVDRLPERVVLPKLYVAVETVDVKVSFEESDGERARCSDWCVCVRRQIQKNKENVWKK